MSIRLKHTVVCLSAIPMVSFLLAFNAYAQEGTWKFQGQHRYEKIEDFSKTLNLTAEQQEKIKKHEELNRDKAIELRKNLQDKRAELRGELEKPQIDKGRVNALIGEIKNLQGEQLERMVNNTIFMKEVLTAEQFKKLKEKRQERMKELKKDIKG